MTCVLVSLYSNTQRFSIPGMEMRCHEGESRQFIELDIIEGSSLQSNPIYSFIRHKVTVKAVQQPV